MRISKLATDALSYIQDLERFLLSQDVQWEETHRKEQEEEKQKANEKRVRDMARSIIGMPDLDWQKWPKLVPRKWYEEYTPDRRRNHPKLELIFARVKEISSKGKIWIESQSEPIILNRIGSSTYALSDSGDILVLYQNSIYTAKGVYTDEEIRLSVLEFVDKERKRFESLRNKFDKQTPSSTGGDIKRKPIPEEVRIFVWRRDQGKCVRCGSRDNLEYDHIIPVSQGGGNTSRNIELLCEQCNRSKSDNIQ